MDMTGEARDDDAAAFVCVEQVVQHLADGALTAGEPRFVRVRRVGQQQPNPVGLRDRTNARQVGEPAVDRREVELEVTGVQDRALGRVERGREPVRH